MELIGTVLWWDKDKRNGIVVDPQRNEFYFDFTVLNSRIEPKIKEGKVVLFNYDEEIQNCLCIKSLKLPTIQKEKKLEREFTQLSL